MQNVVPAVLVYIFSGDEVLMLHRNTRPGDYHAGKYNGLGGKLEPRESPHEAAVREVKEEAGLILALDQFQTRGVLHFPEFKPSKANPKIYEDWTVFVFTVELLSKPVLAPFATGLLEGTLEWVQREKILSLPLWPGDPLFLKNILEGQNILGTVWYDGNGQVKKHHVEVMKAR